MAQVATTGRLVTVAANAARRSVSHQSRQFHASRSQRSIIEYSTHVHSLFEATNLFGPNLTPLGIALSTVLIRTPLTALRVVLKKQLVRETNDEGPSQMLWQGWKAALERQKLALIAHKPNFARQYQNWMDQRWRLKQQSLTRMMGDPLPRGITGSEFDVRWKVFMSCVWSANYLSVSALCAGDPSMPLAAVLHNTTIKAWIVMFLAMCFSSRSYSNFIGLVQLYSPIGEYPAWASKLKPKSLPEIPPAGSRILIVPAFAAAIIAYLPAALVYFVASNAFYSVAERMALEEPARSEDLIFTYGRDP